MPSSASPPFVGKIISVESGCGAVTLGSGCRSLISSRQPRPKKRKPTSAGKASV